MGFLMAMRLSRSREALSFLRTWSPEQLGGGVFPLCWDTPWGGVLSRGVCFSTHVQGEVFVHLDT